MRLKNDQELHTSRQKLKLLLEAIEEKEQATDRGPGYQWSLGSIRRLADQIRGEIEEYEQAHQPSESK